MATTIVEWPSEKKYPTLSGRSRSLDALAVVHQLARGVVDRRDVVGVKGVSRTEGVGEDADADAEALVVARDDEDDEDAEAEDVQEGDGTEHPARAAPSRPW